MTRWAVPLEPRKADFDADTAHPSIGAGGTGAPGGYGAMQDRQGGNVVPGDPALQPTQRAS